MAFILIVEDDPDVAETLADVFAARGHTTTLAMNGREGLEAVREHVPDLILLDVEMPVMDGPAMALAVLVEDAGKELVPIIVSSGYPDLPAVAARVGTPYAISKPCRPAELWALVDRALTERHPPRPPHATVAHAGPPP
jgi:CheY-like chemotaxis protein